MKQYLDLLQKIMDEGIDKSDRTGVGTRSVFGAQARFDLSEGFPLLTTKKVFLKGIIHELIWFIQGDTNLKYLVDNGVRIWNEWPYNGQRAHTMAPFEHLHGFTPNSLKTVAIRAGFKSVNNLYVWVQYPKEMLRSYIGKLFPKFGQTFLLLKINE